MSWAFCAMKKIFPAVLAKERSLTKQVSSGLQKPPSVALALILCIGVCVLIGVLNATKAWAADYSVSVAQGESVTVDLGNTVYGDLTWTVEPECEEITVSTSSSGDLVVSAGDEAETGNYSVDVKYSYWNGWASDTVAIDVTVTSSADSGDSGGDSDSTTIEPGNRYYHFDFRIAATIEIVVLNEDGSVSTVTVTGEIDDPSVTIYNTSSKTWGSHSWLETTENGVSYFEVSFKDESSSDGGEYEYMMDPDGTPGRQAAEFYNGDTAVLSYTLTYSYDADGDGVAEEHVIQLTETRVLLEEDNVCNSKDKTDTQRGFDIVVSASDISSAMSTSQLQVGKIWNDNGNAMRPEYISVVVYRSIGGEDGTEYLTLTLREVATDATAHAPGSTEVVEGVNTSDYEGVSIKYSDNFGVVVTGLPQNYWVMSGSTYEYVSCSYTVEEVTAAGNANFEAVYGSFVYVDDTEKNSYVVTITNTLAYEKLAVKKAWTDSETDDHNGDSVTVNLSAYYMLDDEEKLVPDEWLASFIGGSTTLTLSSTSVWYGVWGYMPVYYTVEDDASTEGVDESAAYQITKFEVEETAVNVDNGETYTASVSGISSSKDENGNYYFTITNTPKPKVSSVVVTKEVTGNLGDQTKQFSFVYKIGASGAEQTFSLSHGESLMVENVSIGETLYIKEIGADDYAVVVKIDSNELTADENGWYLIPVSSETAVTVDFINGKNVEIDTGLSLSSIPYALALGAVLLGAVFLIRRVLVRNEED